MARYDRTRAAVKLHTQLDLRGPLPATVQITPARQQEVLWLDALDYEAGAFYLMDRGFVDYSRLHTIERARAWFVIRAKSAMLYCRLHSHPVDRTSGLRSDQTIKLTGLTRTSKQSVFRQNVENAGELVNGFPNSLEELAPFRVVALSNLRPADLTPAQQDILARFCSELGGGVLSGRRQFDGQPRFERRA